MKREYCVYVHTNKVNGKRYVGVTSTSVKARWANGSGYKSNGYFYRAIKKYGWHEGFIHEIVKSGLTKKDAYSLEVKLIAAWNTIDPSKGYNIDKGGNGSNRITEETRKKISAGVRRYFKEHPEARDHNAERLRNMPRNTKALDRYREENPNYGKIHGEWLRNYYADHPEMIRKSRAKCREYYNKHPEARLKKSEQTRRYFVEHPEAREHNAKKTHDYYQNPDVKKWKSEERKRYFAEHPEKKTTKKVSQFALDGNYIKCWNSCTEAGSCTGINYKLISACATGKQKTAGGYVWRYENELQNKTI